MTNYTDSNFIRRMREKYGPDCAYGDESPLELLVSEIADHNPAGADDTIYNFFIVRNPRDYYEMNRSKMLRDTFQYFRSKFGYYPRMSSDYYQENKYSNNSDIINI